MNARVNPITPSPRFSFPRPVSHADNITSGEPNLKLGSPLVMLSACETGLGKEKRGEGVMGLTRAFMYAGAPTVGVSLWSVADKSTADLMSDFYRRLLSSN